MITGVHLITGLIGSGKTLRAVWYIEQEVKAGRAVYACNLNGLNIPGVIPWEDPRQWRDLPPGSLLVVDEAQRYWRARRAGEVPEELQAMETSRHDAVSFLILTQQPTYLDKHLRGLVTRHEHLYRRLGLQSTNVYMWERCVDDPTNAGEKDGSDQSTFVYPKHLFGAYTSSEQHTVKFKLGGKAKLVIVGLVFALGLFGYTIATLGADEPKAGSVSATLAPASGPDTARTGAVVSAFASVEAYNEAHKPRIATKPWTAPIFDGRRVAADPGLYCASSQAGEDADGNYREASCTCITEQGTPYGLTPAECRMVARQGAPYNAYKQPRREVRQMQAPAKDADPKPATPTGVVLDGEEEPAGGEA